MRTLLLMTALSGLLPSSAAHARPSAAPAGSIGGGEQRDLVALGNVPKSCYFKGRRLWGKVQVVTAFPDLKVQVVTAFPDLKVQRVTAFPDKCGKWQLVKSFPDIKVKFVKSFPDIKVKFVNAFPGVP